MLHYSKKKHQTFLKAIKAKKKASEIEKKLFEKAYLFLHPLSYLSSIKMIGICNSLSMNAGHKNSDIDLFVIAKKNRLWTARLLISLYFMIIGERKTKKKHAWKFCLSFFITEENINLKDIALDDDIYLYFWILYCKPIIVNKEIYEKFIEANQSWCNFDEYGDIIEKNESFIMKKNEKSSKNSKFWDMIENIIKKILLRKTLASKEKLRDSSWIVISDTMLKFHNNDMRKYWREKLKEVGT